MDPVETTPLADAVISNVAPDPVPPDTETPLDVEYPEPPVVNEPVKICPLGK